MAQFGRNARKDSKAQEISEPEVTEATEVVEVESTEPDADAEFDNLMASFTNDDANNASQEEVKDMAKQDTHDAPEVKDAEVVEDVKTPSESDSALSDAAKEIADRANGKAVEMLSVDSLPPVVPHIKNAIVNLDPMVVMIKDAVKEWNANTSGSDEKIKHAIATLTVESDPENFKRREAIAAAKAEIARLEEQMEADETKLYADVEGALAAKGDVIWSEETKDQKREYINALYAGYLLQHKGVEQFIEAHNKAAAEANKVGALEQYHTKLDKPFKRAGSSSSGGTGVRKSSGAPRNVSVGEASVSYDGGVTWTKGEGQFAADKPMVSNPTFLSALMAKQSNESGSVLKARIYETWYGDNGSADGSPIPAEDVKDVSEFDMTYQDKNGELKTAKVRIVKKASAND